MLLAYFTAQSDPDHELSHYYEIVDALKARFDNKPKRAQETLGIDSTTWGRFEHLCNEHGVLEGRHPGLRLGPKRHATRSAIDEARRIAKRIMDSYFSYLRRELP